MIASYTLEIASRALKFKLAIRSICTEYVAKYAFLFVISSKFYKRNKYYTTLTARSAGRKITEAILFGNRRTNCQSNQQAHAIYMKNRNHYNSTALFWRNTCHIYPTTYLYCSL